MKNMRGRKPVALMDRFSAGYVVLPECGCWIWMGALTPRGYGKIRVGSKLDNSRSVARAHRIAWDLHFGPIPEGLLVCHRCDVPSCVNPAHLFVGSSADNVRDMVAKGRANPPRLCGEQGTNARLTSSEVEEIRRRAGTVPRRELAEEYGISVGHVGALVRLDSWAQLSGQAAA